MIIEYAELSRTMLQHGGYRILGEFKDADPNGTFNKTYPFYVDSEYPSEAMVTARVDYYTNRAYYSANPLNKFKLGVGDERAVVNTAVTHVRTNPATTTSALTSAVDAANPGMIWKPSKFLSAMHKFLEQKMNQTYTFEAFKQFLIDEKFIGVD